MVSSSIFLKKLRNWLKSTLLTTTFSQGPGKVFREWGWNGKEKGRRVWFQPPSKWSWHQPYALPWSQVICCHMPKWHTLDSHSLAEARTNHWRWAVEALVYLWYEGHYLSAFFFSQPPIVTSKSFPFFFFSSAILPCLDSPFYYSLLWSLHVLNFSGSAPSSSTLPGQAILGLLPSYILAPNKAKLFL